MVYDRVGNSSSDTVIVIVTIAKWPFADFLNLKAPIRFLVPLVPILGFIVLVGLAILYYVRMGYRDRSANMQRRLLAKGLVNLQQMRKHFSEKELRQFKKSLEAGLIRIRPDGLQNYVKLRDPKKTHSL